MRLNEVTYTDAKPVEGYGPGFFRIGGEVFRIGGEVFRGGVLVSGAGITAWGGYGDAEALLALVEHVDVLFIGTGADVAHIPADLRTQLESGGLGVEAMSSPAAARTYNVLLSEGRRIALAMLPV